VAGRDNPQRRNFQRKRGVAFVSAWSAPTCARSHDPERKVSMTNNDELIIQCRAYARALGLPRENSGDAEIDLWLNQFTGKGYADLKRLADHMDRTSFFVETIAEWAFPAEHQAQVVSEIEAAAAHAVAA